jgi:hypothetical protein
MKDGKESNVQMKGDDIAARLVALAVIVVKIVGGLPATARPTQLGSDRTESLVRATPGVAVPRARRMLSARLAIPS